MYGRVFLIEVIYKWKIYMLIEMDYKRNIMVFFLKINISIIWIKEWNK